MGRKGNRNSVGWYTRKYAQDIILSKLAAPGPFPLIFVLDRLKAGFNLPKIIRTANAFGAREVHLVGIGVFDPSPAAGSLRHTKTRKFETIQECFAALKAEGYTVFGLDMEGEGILGQVPLPEKTAFVFGHERDGLSFGADEAPDVRILRIPQFGKVESLNVSVVAGMAGFEYLRQRQFTPPSP